MNCLCAITESVRKFLQIISITGVRYAHQRLRLMVVGSWRDTCCVLRIATKLRLASQDSQRNT